MACKYQYNRHLLPTLLDFGVSAKYLAECDQHPEVRVAYSTIGWQEDNQLPSTQWGQDWWKSCLASNGKEQCGPGEILAVPQVAIQGPYMLLRCIESSTC